MEAPARVTATPFTSTSAAMTNDRARGRFSTRPRSTSASSRRRRSRAPPSLPAAGLCANPGPEWSALHMADGNGQGVGSVVRVRCGLQAEDQPDHLLYLSLVSFPIPNYRLLYLRRGIFGNGNITLRRCQQHRSSRLPDRHRRRHVLGKKERLHRDGARSMEINQTADSCVNQEKALRHRLVTIGHDDAVIDRLRIGFAFDYPVAQARRPRVEPDRNHARLPAHTAT